MVRLFLLASSYLVLAACGEDTKTGKAVAAPDTIQVNSPVPKDPKVLVEQYKDLIIGTWESEDKQNPPLVITREKYVTKYTGETADSASYALALSSCSGDNNANNVYLYVDYDHCYAVEKLDGHRMVLTYMGQGAQLVYKRSN